MRDFLTEPFLKEGKIAQKSQEKRRICKGRGEQKTGSGGENFQHYRMMKWSGASRHLLLPSVGMEGQRVLKAGRVLIVGVGGLGNPAAIYLAAAGVGKIGLLDKDIVEKSNLHRQVLYSESDIGKSKVDAAKNRLHDVNPNINVETYELVLDSSNAMQLLKEYDVVIDGTDNFPARYLINDACVLLGKPDVYASIFRFDGQASVFYSKVGPCYRCLFPEPPPPDTVPSCADGGVLGVLPGIMGSIQAIQAINLLLGRGEPLIGTPRPVPRA